MVNYLVIVIFVKVKMLSYSCNSFCNVQSESSLQSECGSMRDIHFDTVSKLRMI